VTKNIEEAQRISQPWLWLTLPISLLLAIATLAGILIGDLYQANTPLMAAQLVGGDYAALIGVVPLLAGSALLAKRGSQRALLIWIGCLCFLVYFYLVFSFHVHFNTLFPAYLGLLGCSLYGLIFALAGTDFAHIRARFSDRTPVKVTSIALAIIPILFYVMGLGDIIPAILTGTIPENVVKFGAPTYFAHVIDMAISLPAFVLGAVYLWQRKPIGYGLGGGLLTFVVLIMVSLLSMFAVQAQRGLTVTTADVAVIGTVAAVYLALLVWFLGNLGKREM
jgi:hypothetical protein